MTSTNSAKEIRPTPHLVSEHKRAETKVKKIVALALALALAQAGLSRDAVAGDLLTDWTREANAFFRRPDTTLPAPPVLKGIEDWPYEHAKILEHAPGKMMVKMW